MTNGSVGARMAALRELAGMPQEKLAAAAHVSLDLVRARRLAEHRSGG